VGSPYEAWGGSNTGSTSGKRTTGKRRKNRKKKKIMNRVRSVEELKNPFIDEAGINSYGRGGPTAMGKSTKQSIYFSTGSRYNICDYPNLDDPADDALCSPAPSSIGKMNSSMLRSQPQQAWGRAGRTDYTKMYLSKEQCKGGQAQDSPGPTYTYSCNGKQAESTKRSLPIQAFLSEFRKDMGAYAPENFAGEVMIVRSDRPRTEFGGNFNTKKHMDKVKERHPAFKFGSDVRKDMSDEGMQCSPGPVYKVPTFIGHGSVRALGQGPAFSCGTSQRQQQAFGMEVDERSYSNMTSVGASTHYSRLKSATKCGFGSYSSRSQPVMSKLDKSW